MGTNYSVRINCCPHCERYEEIHIGKYSYKHVFIFQGYKDVKLTSYTEWKEFLSTKHAEMDIFDEDGEKINFDTFFELIDSSNVPENTNYFQEALTKSEEIGRIISKTIWMDDKQFPFMDCDFS